MIREEIRFVEEGLIDKANNPIKVHLVLNQTKVELFLHDIEREPDYYERFLDLSFNNSRTSSFVKLLL